MKGIYFALAITACVSNAEKAKFNKLLSLQNEMVDSLYEDAHDSFPTHHQQPLERNPYMDEYTVGFDHHSAMDHLPHGMAEHAAYYDDHHYDPDSHNYDLEHNPYEYDNYPVVVNPLYDEGNHYDAFAYETYRDYPHESVVPFVEGVYHEPVVPVYNDDYEHHEYGEEQLPVYNVEIPTYETDPYGYDHHQVGYH